MALHYYLILCIIYSKIKITTLFNYESLFEEKSKTDQQVSWEAHLEATRLINLYQYPAENHTTITKDGYILTIHRIPHGRTNTTLNKIPVFLQHGFLGSSPIWFDNMEKSIGFMLADEGYDVWMGNFRGNYFSSQHLTLSAKSRKFWNFGWDKFAKYDIPAMIDYVINKTGYSQILTVGHSMGALTLLVSTVSQSEMKHKIKGIVAIAPVAYPRYSVTFLKFIKYVLDYFPVATQVVFGKNFLINAEVFSDILIQLCPSSSFNSCRIIVDLLVGVNPTIQNQTRLPIYFKHYMAGTATTILHHWNQLFDAFILQGYNYGKQANLEEYNQIYPIQYDLKKVPVPVALMYAANDAIATVIDNTLISRSIPHIIGKKMLTGFATHVDYLLSNENNIVIKNIFKWLNELATMK